MSDGTFMVINSGSYFLGLLKTLDRLVGDNQMRVKAEQTDRQIDRDTPEEFIEVEI